MSYIPETPRKIAKNMRSRIDSQQEGVIYPDLIKSTKCSEGDGPYVVDVVFSFDTTGSMRQVIGSVRDNLKETIDRLFNEIEGIRIGLLVHGDYCDFPDMMWKCKLTRDVDAIKQLITSAPNTSGGDYDECYELVLKTANTMNWKADVKVLVVIGDASPHEAGYSNYKTECQPVFIKEEVFDNCGKLVINWKDEAQKCKDNKITIFACHAMPEKNEKSIAFYEHISTKTGGYYFPLDELQAFKDYMVAICMKAADGAEDIKILAERQRELQEMIEKKELDAKEREEAIKESQEVSKALENVERGELFSQETQYVASAVKSAKRISSRVEKFEEELYNSNSRFYSNKSSNAFMNVMSNRPMETPSKFKSSEVKYKKNYSPENVFPWQNKNEKDDEESTPGV